MAKFYIESGDVKVIKTGGLYLSVLIKFFRTIIQQNIDIKFGEEIAINECGFIGDLADKDKEYDLKYINYRKAKCVEITDLRAPGVPFHIEDYGTLFINTEQLLGLIELPGE